MLRFQLFQQHQALPKKRNRPETNQVVRQQMQSSSRQETVEKTTLDTTTTTTTSSRLSPPSFRPVVVPLPSDVQVRAFLPWNVSREGRSHLPIPCVPAEPNWNTLDIQEKSYPKQQGFLFVKPCKTGSSTASSITLRLAYNVAKRVLQQQQQQQQQQQPETPQSGDHTNIVCKNRVEHNHASKMKYAQRDKDHSFLWSMVRDPTARTVSQFFHFAVSREDVSSNDTSFQAFLRKYRYFGNYHIRYLGLPRRLNGKQLQDEINRILQEYDFIGVTERMDESILALQMILGLTTSDVMYLPAKSSGGYDDGRFQNRCVYIQPSFVSPGMKDFFASPAYQKAIYWDQVLYQAVNASLDQTIDRLGRTEFYRGLDRFQQAKRKVSQACTLQNVKFPCSVDGIKRAANDTDCLLFDMGCGFDCIDRALATDRVGRR